MSFGDNIIFVEGPSGVGKTPLVNYLSSVGFKKYNCVYIPSHFDHYDGFINWRTPYESYAEMMTISNMHGNNLNIVVDRSPLSLMLYNREHFADPVSDIKEWFNLLRKWKYAVIVCMMTSISNLKRNSEKKNNDFVDMRSDYHELYDMVPLDLKFYHHVTSYRGMWRGEMAMRLVNSMISDVAIENK